MKSACKKTSFLLSGTDCTLLGCLLSQNGRELRTSPCNRWKGCTSECVGNWQIGLHYGKSSTSHQLCLLNDQSLTGHCSAVESVCFDSSESLVAGGSAGLLSVCACDHILIAAFLVGGVVKIWDLDKQKGMNTSSCFLTLLKLSLCSNVDNRHPKWMLLCT